MGFRFMHPGLLVSTKPKLNNVGLAAQADLQIGAEFNISCWWFNVKSGHAWAVCIQPGQLKLFLSKKNTAQKAVFQICD
jgi:hypothetical protein